MGVDKMSKDVNLFDLDSFLEEECVKYNYVVQAKSFGHLDDLNDWLRKNSSIVSVKDIKFQATDDWDAYLVIFEIKKSDLEKLEAEKIAE
jgi:uncharacterized protein YeeX (DUF496 family)